MFFRHNRITSKPCTLKTYNELLLLELANRNETGQHRTAVLQCLTNTYKASRARLELAPFTGFHVKNINFVGKRKHYYLMKLRFLYQKRLKLWNARIFFKQGLTPPVSFILRARRRRGKIAMIS